MTHKESTRNPALTQGAVETVGPVAQQLPHLNYHGQNGHHKLNGFSAHIEVGSGPLSLVNGFTEHGSIIQPPGLMRLQPMIREEEIGVTIIKVISLCRSIILTDLDGMNVSHFSMHTAI